MPVRVLATELPHSAQSGWLAESAVMSSHLLLLLPRMGYHLDQHVSFYLAI